MKLSSVSRIECDISLPPVEVDFLRPRWTFSGEVDFLRHSYIAIRGLSVEIDIFNLDKISWRCIGTHRHKLFTNEEAEYQGELSKHKTESSIFGNNSLQSSIDRKDSTLKSSCQGIDKTNDISSKYVAMRFGRSCIS